MKLPAFRQIRAALAACVGFLSSLDHHTAEGSPLDPDVMKGRFPELARAISRLETSTAVYERSPSLTHIEETLSDAAELLDCFDPAKYHFEPGDPYSPEEMNQNHPALWASVLSLLGSVDVVKSWAVE